MRVISDGNFSPWFRWVMWASGIVVGIVSYRFLPWRAMFFGVVIGMVITAIGTYSERANLLNIGLSIMAI